MWCFSALFIVTVDTITNSKIFKENKIINLKRFTIIYIRIISPFPNIPIIDSGTCTVVLCLSARYTVEMCTVLARQLWVNSELYNVLQT